VKLEYLICEKKYDATLNKAIFNCVMYNIGNNSNNDNEQKEYNLLKEYYYKIDDSIEKVSVLQALSLVQNEKILTEHLKWILNSNDVKSEHKIKAFKNVSQTIIGRKIAWNFLKEHWSDFMKIADFGFLTQDLCKTPSDFHTVDELNDVHNFYSKLNAPQCDRSMKQCIETIQRNIFWKEKMTKGIEKWLDQYIVLKQKQI